MTAPSSLMPWPKALVGHVQERGELARLDGGDDLVPLRGGDVVARGVVAAGMQHDDGARGRRVQRSQHAVEVDAAGGRVVVGVGLDHETGRGEQRAVVFPAGVADHDLGVGRQLLEEVSADLQAAGAANALGGDHAAALDRLAVGAEHQALDGGVIGGHAVHGQVAAWLGRIHHLLFGGLDAFEQRQLAVVVEINADAQVDLVGVGVCGELFVQAQDRVARGHFDGGKQRHEIPLESCQ
jgi:hypothetical protein